MIRVAVLVSAGRHPVSGRARRAARDARALELALRLPDARIEVIHAGDPDEPGLRDYLGMGIGWLRVLRQPAGADPVQALVTWLRATPPDLILAGTRAEVGEGSGLLPYLIAEALDVPLVAAIADGAIEGRRARLLQALPRGQRRALSAPLPLVATVDTAAPAPRASAYGPARRGRIEVAAAGIVPDEASSAWERGPARPRPKRLRAAAAGTAEERLRAATQMAGGGGATLVNPDPETAADAIWDFLVREGMVAPAERDRGAVDGTG